MDLPVINLCWLIHLDLLNLMWVI